MAKATWRDFVGAFRAHWLEAMSGSASVPFAIAAVIFQPQWQKVLLLGAAILCGWVAAFRVWRTERERADTLQERLRPIIDVFLDPNTKGVRFVDTVVYDPTQPLVPPKDGPGSLWVQLTVRSKTDAPLYDCEIRTLSLTSESGHINITEPLWAQWSNGVAGQRAMLIPSGVPQPANLMAFDHHASRLSSQLVPEKAMLDKKIQNPNVFIFRIAVSARDAVTEYRDAKIIWDGDPDHLRIELS
jgi:hypothetical protein